MAFAEAAYSALGIVLLSGCGVLSYNQITYMGCHNGGKLRTAVCGLIYRKVSVCRPLITSSADDDEGDTVMPMIRF